MGGNLGPHPASQRDTDRLLKAALKTSSASQLAGRYSFRPNRGRNSGEVEACDANPPVMTKLPAWSSFSTDWVIAD
jgi:hypothetical protein